MSTTKPSDAAMRAAEQLHAEGRLHPDIRRGFAITEAAQVIDRELSAPSMEQRARAAAQELFEQRWIPPIYVVKSIILSHFIGMQGGNEKLREALDQAAKDIGRLLGRARFTTPEDAAALPRIKEALAQSSDRTSAENVVDVLDTVVKILRREARAALKSAGERG